jgi:SAM-dependent MidA family methyltransferase
VEISPQRAVMMQAICKHITTHGGSALIGDYGHWGEKEDTLRVCINIYQTVFLIINMYINILSCRDFINIKLLMHFQIQEISI